MPSGRVIAHIDLDAFYAQVEHQLDPSLDGLPVAVVQHNKYQGGAIIALDYAAKGGCPGFPTPTPWVSGTRQRLG